MIFKLFDRFSINTFNAIVFNYVVACVTGLLLYPADWHFQEVISSDWFGGTVFLGIMFIVIFMVMAKTSQQIGLSTASVAGKMSLIIPVIFGIMVYKESLNPWKITGIVMALLAVYLVSFKKKSAQLNRKNILLPVVLFAGSGIIDTTLKYLETHFVPQEEYPLYSASIFGVAAVIGLLVIGGRTLVTNNRVEIKDILGGVVLGIPNYFSIYFILKALGKENLESSVIFSINNVAIVMLTTLLGIALFGEKLTPKNKAGVALAVLSILLIALTS